VCLRSLPQRPSDNPRPSDHWGAGVPQVPYRATHANATRAVHSYNAAGWVTGLVNAKSDGTTLTSHDYTYDPAR
jgi:hypothetical protein